MAVVVRAIMIVVMMVVAVIVMIVAMVARVARIDYRRLRCTGAAAGRAHHAISICLIRSSSPAMQSRPVAPQRTLLQTAEISRRLMRGIARHKRGERSGDYSLISAR